MFALMLIYLLHELEVVGNVGLGQCVGDWVGARVVSGGYVGED